MCCIWDTHFLKPSYLHYFKLEKKIFIVKALGQIYPQSKSFGILYQITPLDKGTLKIYQNLAQCPEHKNFKFANNSQFTQSLALFEKCPYSEFFWSVFSRIWTRKIPSMDTFHGVWQILFPEQW